MDFGIRLDVAASDFGMRLEQSLHGGAAVSLKLDGSLGAGAQEALLPLGLQVWGQLEPSVGWHVDSDPAVIFVPEVVDLGLGSNAVPLAVFRPDAPWIGDSSMAKTARMRRWPDRPLIGSAAFAEAYQGLQWTARLEALSTRGQISGTQLAPVRPGPGSALAAVAWADEPHANWRVRVDLARSLITLNRAYVVLSGDPLRVRQTLDAIEAELARLVP